MVRDESKFGPRGQELYDALAKGADAATKALAEEAARIADRLDELDRVIAGKGVLQLMRFRLASLDFDDPEATVEVKFDNVLGEARQQANVLRQMLVTLGVGAKQNSGAGPSEQKGSALDELNARRAAREAGAAR